MAQTVEERLEATRGTQEYFVIFDQADRDRAREARKHETLSARIARRRGWIPIAPTPHARRYISELAALNLRCPWNEVADWHGAMWTAPPEEIEDHSLWVEAKEWETSKVLGTEGIYDARAALRRCRAQWRIGPLRIGGHPQGWGVHPVYAAGHARAVIDMVHRQFRRGGKAVPAGGVQPLEAALWLGREGQRDWACAMAQKLQREAGPAEAALWEHWCQEIRQIEREGAQATWRWGGRRPQTE